eukprot:CAMPEP_0196660062 /NCGR_PEP_ID=MMETSP1086-20130531/37930_1 /TAXON_ID=77921 /ORGANISM="Cyanoptyche  gloeocystis , Strain SAG4.97" /LENGTH=137 /DNA_ID=CAMNT_0041994299 /DNA_START=102 /DNA_END=513 /DNA_ORIENTATION=+
MSNKGGRAVAAVLVRWCDVVVVGGRVVCRGWHMADSPQDALTVARVVLAAAVTADTLIELTPGANVTSASDSDSEVDVGDTTSLHLSTTAEAPCEGSAAPLLKNDGDDDEAAEAGSTAGGETGQRVGMFKAPRMAAG